MYEGTNAVLYLDEKTYEISYYKIAEDDENFFCYNIEMVVVGQRPNLTEDSYTARLEVNGDAVWYFPWVWFGESNGSQLKAAVHGAIFCPFGLSDEEEERYESLNLLVASDACYSMTAEVWKNLLFIFADWLRAKSIPQYQEYIELAEEIDLDDESFAELDEDDEIDFDDDEEEDDDEDDYEDDK